MNNENTWTQGGEHHTLRSVVGELGERQWGLGSWGGITRGKMPDIGDGEEGSKPHCHVCTYAKILHVVHMYPKTYNPIKNLKKKEKKIEKKSNEVELLG